MLRPLLVWFPLAALLFACLPQTQGPPSELRPLERAEYSALLAPFVGELQDLKVTPRRAYGFAYSGEATHAFAGVLRQFYAEYPGFCPLEGGSFFPAPEGARYMTVAVKGREVRAFVYDHSTLPRFQYLYLEGSVPDPLEGVCPRP